MQTTAHILLNQRASRQVLGISNWSFSIALKEPALDRCFLREDPCLRH